MEPRGGLPQINNPPALHQAEHMAHVQQLSTRRAAPFQVYAAVTAAVEAAAAAAPV